MRELAQKNQRTGGRLLGLIAALHTIESMFRPRLEARIRGIAVSSSGHNRAEHKLERQRVRYARMHNRKGSHV